jgi:hypothetical protein
MEKSLKKIAAKEEKKRKHLAAVERVRIATAKVFGYPYISISEHDQLNATQQGSIPRQPSRT